MPRAFAIGLFVTLGLGCGSSRSSDEQSPPPVDGAAPDSMPIVDATGGEDARRDAADEGDGRAPLDAPIVTDGASDADASDSSDASDASSTDAVSIVDAAVLDGSVAVGACPSMVTPPAACGASLCGNGQIDQCQECSEGGAWPDGGPICTSSSEHCDGTNLGGMTCASFGFAGGTLRCNASCGFDFSGCNHCGSDPSIVSCGTASVDATGAATVAMAANATAIGLAWTTGPNFGASPQPRGLHVAVLAPDLTLQKQVGCLGSNDVGGVAIAATPSGWIVAAQTSSGVAIYPLLADGTPVGSAETIAAASVPILAGNPGGGPLLVWVSTADQNGYATLLGRDGSVGITVPVVANVEDPFGSAAYVGDGFLVALRATTGDKIVHVGLDGSVGTAHSLGVDTETPNLAWTGTEARVTYGDFSGNATIELLRVDGTGSPLGSPVALGSIPQYYDTAPIVSVGSDTVVLLPGYTGFTDIASRLDVGRFTSSGQPVHTPYLLGQAGLPQNGAFDVISPWVASLRGPDLVAAWVTGMSAFDMDPTIYPSGIDIARVSP